MEKNRQIVTIFGGTGDLTYRKLLPAFYNLKVTQKLPEYFHIVIIGRRDFNDESYRQEVSRWIQEFSRVPEDKAKLEDFLQQIMYYKMTFTQGNDYHGLKDYYQNLCPDAHHLYYMAVAPTYFTSIAKNLQSVGLNKEADLIIEKPFGTNLQSAIDINTELTHIFTDKHIYRIDHYVAKEMVQNIFTLRFANSLFKYNWDSKTIKSIQISALETVGVENRGNYYDHTGAIKDMIQNHLLQILSIVTMNEPSSFSSDAIDSKQIEILKNLHIDNYESDVVIAQYDANKDSLSYLNEENVNPESTTETFAALKVGIDLPEWKETPIYIRTGKRMHKRTTEVVIEYKPVNDYAPNILIIKIQPDEGIYLKFNIKKPGVDNTVQSVFFDYCQSCIIENRVQTPEAYERLLLAALNQDDSLFASFEVVRLSWEFVEKLNAQLNHQPVSYKAYTDGPKESFELLEKDGNTWIQEVVMGEFH